MQANRRQFLKQGVSAMTGTAAGIVAASFPARSGSAIEPIARGTGGRMKLSCAAYSLRKYLNLKNASMSLEEFIQKCAEWETDGVELTEYYFEKPVTPAYIMRLKRLSTLWGQDITGTPIGNNFALPHGEERSRQIESVKKWIDVSADIGSPAIRIFAGRAPDGVDDAEARKWVVESIEACCDHAARRGVFLAVENHGGVVATADGLLEIVKAVACEWVGVNLDTGNFNTQDPYGDIARCAPYAVTCQVKVEVRPANRAKEPVNMARLVGILRNASYRGYVTLEYEAAEEPMEAVPRYLRTLREAIG